MKNLTPYWLVGILLIIFQISATAQSTATYKVTFDAAWSRTTHPYQFPFDARWSPPVGLTHNTTASLFNIGEVASQGIVNMSQTGSRDPLNDEIDAMIATGGGQYRVNSDIRVNPSPDTISFMFDISETHPYLSLTSMIAPSPDWFVGFKNLNLFENGTWAESRIVPFTPYDSGSDSGVTFASPNSDTQPREGISAITGGPIFAAGDASLGVWRIERIDNNSSCDVNGGSLVGGPFEFCVDGTPDNIPAGAISVSDVSGTNSQWVITDDRGYILGLPPSFTGPDFDAAGEGLCFVYHLSYEDGLTGLAAGNNIADFEGCFNLSNSTYVDRQSDEETCNPDVTARYRVIFDAEWSEATHPVDFPADAPARWSPAVGMTHNAETQFFVDGTVASQGIVNMSQTGSRDPLNDEIDARFIGTGGAEYRINATTRVNPSPDTVMFEFDISSSHPRVSLVSMIAPSPDWFVALRDLNLFENGDFIESKIVQFRPYDSGSDDGISFSSDNQETSPRTGIYPITDGPLSLGGNINSLGVWKLERIDAESNCGVFGGDLAGGPFEFCVDGKTDNIPGGAITIANSTGANSQWVITDANGYILGLPGSFGQVDFDAAGAGLCFIYHLSFEDGLTGLAAGNNIEDLSGCFSLSNSTYVSRIICDTPPAVGAVYAMSNGEGQVAGNVQGPNSVIAYSQAADGTLTYIGAFPTGGNGGDYDGGEGLDPLISAYAITKTVDNKFVLAVNAGSNTVTSMRVNDDFSLTVIDTESTEDIGPNSIAHKPSAMAGVNGLVYVTNITREEFLAQGEPAQQGSVIGYRLMDDGSLEPVANSIRDLENRPSAVQFSPNGEFLAITSINAGSSALANGNEDELVIYAVNADGTLSTAPTAGATSTLRDNAQGRNLPSAIGFQIVGDNYVVVTEAREFRPNGLPPIFPELQDGSVSTWQIQPDGSLVAIDLDVASGTNNTGRTACWLDFSDDNTFFVSNAIEAGLASYSFNNGNIELLNQTAAQGTGATGNTTDPGAAFGTTEGWIDLWISDDGKYLYQCYGLTGEVGVFEINGTELTLIQEIGGLPTNNVQGIVSVGEQAPATPQTPIVGAVFAMSNGRGQIPGNVQGPNSIVAYGQAADGTLSLIGEYPTGGNGGDYDGGEGLDPLISAYAITKTVDNRFVLAVNAGSNTITSLKVNEDFSLTVVDIESTRDVGPNSIAHTPSILPGVNGIVYVSNISRPDLLALGEPGQQGSVFGYKLMDDGSLEPLGTSKRNLGNRPSAVQFSPNGEFLVVASINAGASALTNGNQDEIVVYSVNDNGTLSTNPTAGATSTLRDNAQGRNLPSAIGFQIVGDNYVVVTEAREFRPNGLPPIFPELQDGSVSTWQIQPDGSLTPINLDVASGTNNTGRTACWLDFSDENTFFVSNAIEAGLASYSFDNGNIELLNQTAAQGTGATGNTTDPGTAFGTTEGWIDLWISDDGNYLYQCYGLTGTVGVFEINGAELTLIQEIGGLPTNNVQGIVSVGSPVGASVVDLSIDITVGSSTYNIYEEVNYTVTVTNGGTVDANNVVVAAGLPQGMVFANATVDKGNYELFFEEWTITTLPAGETATLNLTLFTLVDNVDITNTVYIVSSDVQDDNPSNDEASVTVTNTITNNPAQSLQQGVITSNSLTIDKVFPNPTQNELNINLNSSVDYNAEIRIFDVSGRVQSSYITSLSQGVNSMRLDVSNLTNGIYFINLPDGNGSSLNYRFVKVGNE